MQVYAYLVRLSVKEKSSKQAKNQDIGMPRGNKLFVFLLKLDTLKNRSVVAMIRMSQLFSSRQ